MTSLGRKHERSRPCDVFYVDFFLKIVYKLYLLFSFLDDYQIHEEKIHNFFMAEGACKTQRV